MRPALLALALVVPAAAAAEERELWFRSTERRDLARQITRLGLDCPRLHAATLVEHRADGRHIRAVCAPPPDRAEPAVFRLVAGGSGLVRAEPWSPSPFETMSLRPLLP